MRCLIPFCALTPCISRFADNTFQLGRLAQGPRRVQAEAGSGRFLRDLVRSVALTPFPCQTLYSHTPHNAGPCKVIAPKVEAFSVDYTDVLFYKVDVDELNQVASEVGVRAMPTFMLFKNGEKVAEVVGANPSALKV
jgi:hypothetical protein